jgi:hypothetical protein
MHKNHGGNSVTRPQCLRLGMGVGRCSLSGLPRSRICPGPICNRAHPLLQRDAEAAVEECRKKLAAASKAVRDAEKPPQQGATRKRLRKEVEDRVADTSNDRMDTSDAEEE